MNRLSRSIIGAGSEGRYNSKVKIGGKGGEDSFTGRAFLGGGVKGPEATGPRRGPLTVIDSIPKPPEGATTMARNRQQQIWQECPTPSGN